jgi:hypothetical protein
MNGASPNTIDTNGCHTLQLVVNNNDILFMQKKIQIIRLLLQFNVNLDLADLNNYSATLNAANNCNPQDKRNLFILFYLLEAREKQLVGSGVRFLHAKNADGISLADVSLQSDVLSVGKSVLFPFVATRYVRGINSSADFVGNTLNTKRCRSKRPCWHQPFVWFCIRLFCSIKVLCMGP